MSPPALERVQAALADVEPRVVACSGGVDSLLLATLAHRGAPDATVVAHAVTAAVPQAATDRVATAARGEGWRLEIVSTGEFSDERYLSNPADRCYYCKSHLYDALGAIPLRSGWTLLSGANVDDLGEYRPGLVAAAERGVRHPFVEAGLGKRDVRRVAHDLGLGFAALASSPCLASRLYTGTRVTPSRLRAVDAGEEIIRAATGIDVVRCRIREDEAFVEVTEPDSVVVTEALLDRVLEAMQREEPRIRNARLDEKPYGAGRAVVFTQKREAS